MKSLFWRDPELGAAWASWCSPMNFRNGREATRVANTLLKIKHRRFGSIDREGNFLVDAIGGEPGEVVLMADKDAALRELDKSVRQSARFAVLVMRDEDKAEARKRFATPLLFSIHEAGLEYDNIVLYRFVSDHRKDFAEIVDGVEAADLAVENLEYRRARQGRQVARGVQVLRQCAVRGADARSATCTWSSRIPPTPCSACSAWPRRPGEAGGDDRRWRNWQKERASSSCRASRNRPTPSAATSCARARCPWPVTTA